jgi:MYXO-CTERM domain-containing protein
LRRPAMRWRSPASSPLTPPRSSSPTQASAGALSRSGSRASASRSKWASLTPAGQRRFKRDIDLAEPSGVGEKERVGLFALATAAARRRRSPHLCE